MCVCRCGWRLMRGKTKRLFSLFFFFKEQLVLLWLSYKTPLPFISCLSKVCWRFFGAFWGLESGASCHETVNVDLRWEQVQLKSLLAAVQLCTSFTRCHKGRRLLRLLCFVTIVLFLSLCTRPSSSPWHCHNFSFSRHFFFSPPSYAEEHILTISQRKRCQPVLSCPLSLSCMSTICLRQCLPLCVFAQPQQSPL